MMIGGDVVDEEDVDLAEAQPLGAVLEGSHGSVIGVVVTRAERQALNEGRLLGRFRVGGEETADLGREDEVLARMAAQHVTEAVLGEGAAVMRCGVEEPHAAFPGGLERALALALVDDAEHVAERGAAESQRPWRFETGLCHRLSSSSCRLKSILAAQAASNRMVAIGGEFQPRRGAG